MNRILVVPGVFTDHAPEEFPDLFLRNLHCGNSERSVFRIVVECREMIVASRGESMFLGQRNESRCVFIVYGDEKEFPVPVLSDFCKNSFCTGKFRMKFFQEDRAFRRKAIGAFSASAETDFQSGHAQTAPYRWRAAVSEDDCIPDSVPPEKSSQADAVAEMVDDDRRGEVQTVEIVGSVQNHDRCFCRQKARNLFAEKGFIARIGKDDEGCGTVGGCPVENPLKFDWIAVLREADAADSVSCVFQGLGKCGKRCPAPVNTTRIPGE